MSRARDDEGSALVEVVWLGVLLVLPLLWIVVAIGEVQAGAFGTTAAARSAGRAYVLAPDDGTGLVAAREAARQALADQGMPQAPLDLSVTCAPDVGSCHAGGAVVTVRVASRVALPLMPDLFGSGRPSFDLDATHTVPVGRYREVG